MPRTATSSAATPAPALIADFFKQIPSDIPARWDMRKTPAGKAIFDTAGDVRLAIIHALFPAIDAAWKKARAEHDKAEAPADPAKWKYDAYFSALDKLRTLHKLLVELLRAKLAFTIADADALFGWIATFEKEHFLEFPDEPYIRLAQQLDKDPNRPLSATAYRGLKAIRRHLKSIDATRQKRMMEVIDKITAKKPAKPTKAAPASPAAKPAKSATEPPSKRPLKASSAAASASNLDLKAASAKAKELVSALPKSWPKAFEYKFPVDSTLAGKALAKAPPQVRAQAVLFLSKWMLTSPGHIALLPGAAKDDVGAGTRGYGKDMINLLLRADLPFTPAEVELLFRNIASASEVKPWSQPLSGILTLAERLHESKQLTDTAREHLATIRRKTEQDYVNADVRKVLHRFNPILDEGRLNCVAPGEAWSDRLLNDHNALKAKPKADWTNLLQHAFSASSAKPSPAWEKQAKSLIDGVGKDVFTKRLLEWLPLLSSPRTAPWPHRWANTEQTDMLLNDGNVNVLRGLAWMLPLAVTDQNSADISRALARLCETSLKKLPGIGPRLPKLANAAVYALGQIAGEHALGQLARLKTRVTFRTTLQQIEKALEDAAARLGVSKSDLEELGIPAYGFDEHGLRRETFDTVTCELKLDGRNVLTTWTNDKGKTLKSPPASVKEKHADDLKELKLATTDAEKMLTAQRDRIDGLMGIPKTWKLDDFRARYLDHPLISQIARRLIWIADATPVLFQRDDATDVSGKKLKLGKTAEISLWHPANQKTDAIVAWRRRLEDLQLTQPFKQAHREVYLLTDAERRTHTYSNRFAAHILRQHQFAALAAQRGWRNKLRLMVDDEYPPASKDLPHFGLRAEFWVEGIGDDYGTDTLDSGAYLRLATDQVRFYRHAAAPNSAHASGGGYTRAAGRGTGNVNEPLPLTDIPPLAFSEIMRDVDLFVGVASVGNDPTWQDGGPGGRYRDYWQSYSFGDLSETAQTRKAALDRLLPRLTRLRDRAALKDKFLTVKGDLRTYKIHLGSGNILMEPNDQYLCIVPDRSAAKHSTTDLFLPFEGDATLAVILSKAFLLADDKAITDPTITRQIKQQ